MDWPSIISDLQARKLSLVQIAKLCGAGQATISDIKLKPGRDPSFTLGQALLHLHKASDREIARLLKARAEAAEA